MVPFDWVQKTGSTRPRAGMPALSFRERTGLRRLANTERQSSGYLTSRRSLSVRFATPASPGRSEKLLSESGLSAGERAGAGPPPVWAAALVRILAENGQQRAGCKSKHENSVKARMPFRPASSLGPGPPPAVPGKGMSPTGRPGVDGGSRPTGRQPWHGVIPLSSEEELTPLLTSLSGQARPGGRHRPERVTADKSRPPRYGPARPRGKGT